MKTSKLVTLITAAGMACMIGLPAMAQTTTSGDMTPVNAKHEHKKHEHDQKKHEDKKHEDKKAEKDKKADAAKPAAAQAQDQSKKSQDSKKSSALPANQQFSSFSEATARCGSGNVEWATMAGSKVYHNSSSHYFGHTKHGTYACKAALDAAGFHAGS